MKVVLEIDDIKDLNELTKFLMEHNNICLRSISSNQDDYSHLINTTTTDDNAIELNKLLTRPIVINKEYEPHFDDPYPGYEKIPYWMRPDYQGFKPGDVFYSNINPCWRYDPSFTTSTTGEHKGNCGNTTTTCSTCSDK